MKPLMFKLTFWGPCILCLGVLASPTDALLRAFLNQLDRNVDQEVCEKHFEMVQRAYPDAKVVTV